MTFLHLATGLSDLNNCVGAVGPGGSTQSGRRLLLGGSKRCAAP